jgi:Na+-driven multidrug efflux pump
LPDAIFLSIPMIILTHIIMRPIADINGRQQTKNVAEFAYSIWANFPMDHWQ